ncbi:hypothetical protein [Tabrizicola oligotrophica]|uniref:17 kDa surface antigen n=1 Tax=Tabrizicola oligotrophica TaxID=2710650 RepID=A0A6M0QXL6_9RHOB|nr:hypothetical protein [Tabrizicola oligotrophica]NEY91453.1 hypothetical protein [Tabrizicola oligotrophica]
MRKFIALLIIATPLAACMQDPGSRGLAGAALGAAIADSNDDNLLTGAAIGGLAGVASCQIPGTLGCP